MSRRAIVQLGQNPGLARDQLSDASAEILADYGPSVLVQADDEGIETLRRQGLRLRVTEKPETFRVEAFEVSPQRVAQPASIELAAVGGLQAYVLDVAGPLHPQWLERVESLGGELVEQLDEDHHLVRVNASGAASLAAENWVDALLPYYAALKIDPSLLTQETQAALAVPQGLTALALEEHIAPSQPSGDLLMARPETSHTDPGNATVQLFHGVDPSAAVKERLEALGIEVVAVEPESLRIEASPEQLATIAEMPEVRRIDPYAPFRLANNVATGLTKADVLHNHLNLDGGGQAVAVADTGLDTGLDATLMADFQGRVVSISALGRPGNASDPDGHGTHVAGSVLGDGSLSNGTVKGLAPAARLIFQSVLDSSGGLGGLDVGLARLFREARNLGAHIHTNSWGRDTDGAYDPDSEVADRFSFENREFLILFAAGNEAPRRVGSPGSAKNVLTVGASESRRTLPPSVRFPASPRVPSGFSLPGIDLQADNEAHIANFSCPGPARANRRKPDLVAPGTWILSTRSSLAEADTGPDGFGVSPLFPNGTGDESGVPSHGEAVGLGLPGRQIRGAGDSNTPPLPAGAPAGAVEHYMYESGTSMATPITAGACALVRQHLTRDLGHGPSAALLKALVINGALDLGPGVSAMSQGWGRLNLETTLLPPGGLVFSDSLGQALATGGLFTEDLEVLAPGAPLVMTLVWRDFPGAALQNRLLLRLIEASTGQETEAEPIAAIRNNVQKIAVDAVPGRYRVEVEAISVNKGIPEFLPALRQDFALVVAGARRV